MTISTGGFSGDNALLAFAAMQQGRMNDELSESMRIADVRSQMAKDIASIKAHLDGANRYFSPDDKGLVKPEGFIELNKEIQQFMDKYGDEPACADMVASMREVGGSVSLHVTEHEERSKIVRDFLAVAKPGQDQTDIKVYMPTYSDEDITKMLNQLQETLDAAGTNDQLAMIHIKQLNDNINNSSGMVSGIMESRQNTTASIINNLA